MELACEQASVVLEKFVQNVVFNLYHKIFSRRRLRSSCCGETSPRLNVMFVPSEPMMEALGTLVARVANIC